MPIATTAPPRSSVDALHAGMARMNRKPMLWRHPSLRAEDGLPHTVHHLPLDAAAAAGGLHAARRVGWRYLLGAVERPSPSGAAEVHGDAGAEAIAGVNTGPFVVESVRAMESAHGIAGDFEPRLLRVPALYVVALWISERASKRDVVIPLAGSHPALPPRAYEAREFVEELARLARERRGDAATVGGPPAG